MSHFLQPQIILLREGTDTSQGKAQIISNINACMAVADTIRTTLGPRGMDKLVYDGRKVTISNDGATIMKLLDIVHPAAKTLVDISISQDSEVGDGTTSVVLIAAEILKQVKGLVEEGMSPQQIVRGLRSASELAIQKARELSVSFEGTDARQMLEKCASTTLNSKLISGHQDLFSPMVVDAVLSLDQERLDLSNIGIKKVPGGSVRDSFFVRGVAFQKTFSFAGFELMPKKIENPKILLLNVELELRKEKENAEVRLTDPAQFDSIVEAEWQIIYEKLDLCVKTGANVVLSKLAIGDLATQYFADRGLFCSGRVESEDLDRMAAATGARVQSTCNGLTSKALGACGLFYEQTVGDERYHIFTDCNDGRAATIVLRGGTEQFIEESERSIHDALMIVKRSIQKKSIVAGGGAIEMELSKYLREHSRTIRGKTQTVFTAFSKALEVIPRQLAENSGFDPTEVLNKLRQKHATDIENGRYFGVNVNEVGVCNTFEQAVWEPSVNKINSVTAASEAACLILLIDETVRNPKSEQPGAVDANGVGLGRGGPGKRTFQGDKLLKGGRGRGIKTLQGRGGR